MAGTGLEETKWGGRETIKCLCSSRERKRIGGRRREEGREGGREREGHC